MDTTTLVKSVTNGILSIAISLFSCSKDHDLPDAQKLPEQITFSSTSLYPESFGYDSLSKLFVVGSIKHGTLGTVDVKGKYTPLPSDPSWISTFGIKVVGSFAYVSIGDLGNSLKSSTSTATKVAKIVKYDLANKKVVQTYDLAQLFNGAIFPNDLALDDQNNIYVTESLTGFIYKIDGGGNKSIFLKNDAFKGEGFNLNGITFDNRGFLLVDKTNEGKLFKITISDKSVTTVHLSSPITGSDGLFLNGQSLYIVNYISGIVTELKTTDNWISANVASEYATEIGSSAVTLAEGTIYILNARVTEIVTDPGRALSDTYTITKFKGK